LEQVVQRAGRELEAGDATVLLDLLRDVQLRRRHARLLELEVDQQPEARSGDVRVQLEGMARLAQRALVVAQRGQREGKTVAALRVLRVQLDRAQQCGLRFGWLLLLEQDLAETEPRADQQRVQLERLPVRVHCLGGPPGAGQHQAEVAQHVGYRTLLDRTAEVALGLLDRAAMELHDREVAARECVQWIEIDRALVRPLGFLELAGLVVRYAQLVPELRAARLQVDQRAVHLGCLIARATQQQHLRLRLLHQEAVLAALRRQAELAQRLVIERLLPEREAQVVVRERTALGDRRLLLRVLADQLLVARLAVAVDREVGLGMGVAGIQLARAL